LSYGAQRYFPIKMSKINQSYISKELKKMNLNMLKALFFVTLLTGQLTTVTAKAELSEFLDKAKIEKRIREEIADLNINVAVPLGDVDIIEGINIGAKYRYEVEPSYQDQYFTRIDRWQIKNNINVGDVLKDVVEVPFSFSVNRENSFLFVRQFKNNLQALSALPYTPKALPVNAKRALNQLEVGDFVSMPANLSVAVSAGTSTAVVSPVVLSASANVYYVISGEFTIQVFKIDESHVRLKMISKRGYDRGVSSAAGLSFNLFGIRILDSQIEKLVDRDLIQLGYSINPGAQFIMDYVFDLKNEKAAEAYNQILSSTLKFKDIVILNQLDNARELKDKLISSFEKAEKLFETDKNLDPKDRRVSRIFKGFNNYTGHTNHLKLALLLTSFVNDRTYTENKLTYIDKHENDMEFFYPTQSRYMETKLGKWFFELKDQSFQNNFGLIPRFKSEDTSMRDPDIGLTFERKDKLFTAYEQKVLLRYILGQIPQFVANDIALNEWRSVTKKKDSRVFFQLVFKSQGFEFIKKYTREELNKRLLAYVNEKKKLSVLDDSDADLDKLKDFLLVGNIITNEQVRQLSNKLYSILQNPEHNSEEMLKKLIKLNEKGMWDKIGVGFLISLLPQDRLEDLIYVKVVLVGKEMRSVNYEYGRLNYAPLYKELTEVQARLSNRSYDLRISHDDHELEERSLNEHGDDIQHMIEMN
jgi:hypothetical protein